MSKLIVRLLGLSILFGLFRTGTCQQLSSHIADCRGMAATGSALLEFIPNRGQLADQYGKPMPEVLYTLDGHGVKFYFTKNSMHYVFSRSAIPIEPNLRIEQLANYSLALYRVDLRFIGSNPNPSIQELDTVPDFTNYYLSSCPGGITRVPAFHRLLYRNLYPHIDMVLYTIETARQSMKYDFIVHPGGDPGQIRMRFEGADSLAITEGGDLIVQSKFGEVRESKPIAFQSHAVETGYQLSDSVLSFEVGDFNREEDLVIDPPRLWGTYFGGGAMEVINSGGLDRSNCIVVGGMTGSTSNISSTGAHQVVYGGDLWDAFVARFDANGNRLWATYYGGSGSDLAEGCASGGQNALYLAGKTNSATAIATAGAYQTAINGNGSTSTADAFIAKFDSNGVRQWGTYFGGASEEVQHYLGLCVDSSDHVTIASQTNSGTGIATAGAYQTTMGGSIGNFIASFSSAGSIVWATYFLGHTPPSDANVYSIQSDRLGNLYLTSTQQSTSNYSTSGAWQTIPSDWMLSKFSASGSLQWSTYCLGTCVNSWLDSPPSNTLAVGPTAVFVGAPTQCASSVSTAGTYQTSVAGSYDVALQKFYFGGQLAWGTYFGGAGQENNQAVGVDRFGNVYIGGATLSTSGIATSGEFKTSPSTGWNGYLAKFDSTGRIRWSTYYGDPAGLSFTTIAVDPFEHVFAAGGGGSTSGVATAGAYQTTYGGGVDGILVKFCDTLPLPHVMADTQGICPGQSLPLLADSGFTGYQWSKDGTQISGATSRNYSTPTTLTPGQYLYTAVPVDSRYCATGTDSIHVTVFQPPILSLVRDTTVCQRTPVRIGAYATGDAPPFTYFWTPSTGLDHPDSARPIATPLTTTTYYVIVTDTNGCQATDSVTVHLNPLPVAHAGGNKSMCNGSAVQIGLPASGGTAPYVYQWTPSTGLSSSSIASPTASPSVTTKYYVTVQDKNGCTSIDSAVVTVNPLPQLAKLPDIQVCPGTSATIGESATGGTSPYTYRWSPTTGLDDWTKSTPTITPTGSGMYTLTVTDANGCTAMMNQYVAVFDEPHPLINADRTSVYCSTDSALLQLNIGVSTSKWSTGATTRAIRVGPGQYWAEITDLNGCKGYSDTIIITQVAPPAAVVSGPTSACPSSSASYESKDQNIATYAWTLSGGGTITSGQSTPKITVNWTTAGTWQLTLKETMQEGGCERDTTLTVTVDKDLHPTIAQRGPSTICAGDTVKLDATSGYDTYKWSTGETTEAINATKTGDYSVTVSNSAGCTGTSSVVHIDVLPDSVPHPSIIASALTMCAGDSIELRTAKPYASYRWSNGATASSIYVSKAGRYAVTAFNTAGCAGASDSVTVTVNQKPTVTLSALGATSFCDGDSVTLSATKGFSYEWKRDGVAIINTADLLTVKQGGAYTVTATNATGCSAISNAIDVTVKPRPVVSIDGPSSLCLGGESGYRVKGASGGTILWQLNPPTLGTLTGQGTDTITVDWENQQDAGMLTVSVVSDACEGTATLPITIDSKLTPQITANGPLAFCDGGSVTLDAGSGYATYEWRLNGSPIVGRTAHDLTVSQSGTFSVFVTSTGGCSGESAPIAITVYPTPAKPVITRVGNTLSSTVAAQYLWSDNGLPIAGETSQTFTPQHGGRYTVTITDANGCSSTSDPYNFDNSGTATVILPDATRATAGTKIMLPLTLTDATNLAESGANGYHARISYNATILAPSPVSGTEANGIRTMTLIGSLPTPLPTPPFVLQNLAFTATLGTDTCTDVTIDTFYFDNANVAVSYTGGDFCLDGVCIIGGHVRLIDPHARITLDAPHPNPVSNDVTLDYELAEDGLTKLYIQDLLGRTVLVIRDENMKRGKHSEHVTLSAIASGSYRVVLKTPNDTRTERMEVLR